MSEERRKEDEEVLGPLVGPKSLDERAKRIGSFFEYVRGCDTVLADAAAQAAGSGWPPWFSEAPASSGRSGVSFPM